MPVIPALGATATFALYGAAASTVISAAGTGLSMYSQNQQAQTANSMASYNAAMTQRNYAIQRQNADVQARMAQYQANTNAQLAQAQYRSGINNAVTLENQARGIEAQGEEKARRMREEQERVLTMQRAKYAKAGVVNEGSPLVVLADTARLTEAGIQDAAYETELSRQSTLRRADLERYQAGFSLLDAGQSEYEGKIADVRRKIAYREADLTKLSGKAQTSSLQASASGYRAGAIGSLIGGGASLASGASNILYRAR